MNKKLGQHFLHNKNAIKKIVESLNIQPNQTIIEIGPGQGALTMPLNEKCQELNCRLVVVEKDANLARLLKNKISLDNSNIIVDDILDTLLNLPKLFHLQDQKYTIIGNIPYYITGKLLRKLSELDKKPSLTVIMIQKEVAERVCSNAPHMNLLAAAVQFWSKPSLLFSLKPDNFTPPPKVNSAVIKLETRTNQEQAINSKGYFETIHIIFKQPRKTLFNNLRSNSSKNTEEIKNILRLLRIPLDSRPQNLSIEQIKKLSPLIN